MDDRVRDRPTLGWRILTRLTIVDLVLPFKAIGEHIGKPTMETVPTSSLFLALRWAHRPYFIALAALATIPPVVGGSGVEALAVDLFFWIGFYYIVLEPRRHFFISVSQLRTILGFFLAIQLFQHNHIFAGSFLEELFQSLIPRFSFGTEGGGRGAQGLATEPSAVFLWSLPFACHAWLSRDRTSIVLSFLISVVSYSFFSVALISLYFLLSARRYRLSMGFMMVVAFILAMNFNEDARYLEVFREIFTLGSIEEFRTIFGDYRVIQAYSLLFDFDVSNLQMFSYPFSESVLFASVDEGLSANGLLGKLVEYNGFWGLVYIPFLVILIRSAVRDCSNVPRTSMVLGVMMLFAPALMFSTWAALKLETSASSVHT